MSSLAELVDLCIREGGPADLGYVIDTWGRSLRSEYPEARTVDYVGALHVGIKKRIADGARIYIAHPAEEPDVILGWVAVDAARFLVHFVYVRADYRKGGFAKRLVSVALMRPEIVYVEFLTNIGRAIKATHPEQVRHLPTI